MDTVSVIRLVAPEFKDVEDSVLAQWIALAEPYVSEKVFGIFYTQALAYFVCHRMKMAGLGEDVAGAVSGGAASAASGYGIASISAGQSSISFSTGVASSAEQDAEFMRTQYGLQFVQLRKLVVVPITIA